MRRLQIQILQAARTSEINLANGIRRELGSIVSRDKRLSPRRVAVISNRRVFALYGRDVMRSLKAQKLNAVEWLMPEGERYKSLRNLEGALTFLAEKSFERNDLVVALGGGVVGDLAGFGAAVYLRGIPIIQVPTTLLAQIDSSVGGKTAVNLPFGKNLVGAFHPPAGVLVDPQLLDTLPLRELRTGFAEALKHGAIANRGYFDSVVSAIPRVLYGRGTAGDSLAQVIVGSIEIKSGIVARDEHEGGVRKILNFGHTVGHAIEMLSGYSLAHGEAVAIGMTLESRIAERVAIAAGGLEKEIRGALTAAGLPVERPANMDADRILEVMQSDKKARAGEVRYALPRAIGEMAGADSGWTVSVAESIVREVLT